MPTTSFLDKLCLPPPIATALADGFDLAISISGGKDSDAMARLLVELHRQHRYTGRLILVHAHLGRAEHRITLPYIRRFAEQLDVPLHIIKGGDLVDVMRSRLETLEATDRQDIPFWPSAKARYCTSSTKRDPISKFLRTWSGRKGRVICAIGLRAAESPSRARKPVWRERPNVHTQSRTAYDWLPIHTFSDNEVWQVLGYSSTDLLALQQSCQGLTPQEIFDRKTGIHPAYVLGNERLSCALCIFGCAGDLRNGAYQNPAVYREYVDLEIRSGFSFQPQHWLADVAPELLSDHQHAALQALRQKDVPPVRQLPLF